jgi:TonB family protein
MVLQIGREVFDFKPAQRGLGVSLLIHAVLAAALLSVTVPAAQEPPRRFTPVYLPHIPSRSHRRPSIAPPKLPIARPSAAPQPAQISQIVVPQRIEAAVAAPTAPSAATITASVPNPLSLPQLPEPQLPKAPARQPLETAIGQFESIAAIANGHPPEAKVETGGFGLQPTTTAKSARPLGSAAGFGDAQVTSKERAEARVLSSNAFGAVSSAPAVRRTSPGTGVSEPIEILAKPKPIYTEEARRLRIEGEVVLEVLFRASAQVRVLRVLKGLGHGLDASAEMAAMGIRFHPAAEAGRAVDSVATVKIEFQLAD